MRRTIAKLSLIATAEVVFVLAVYTFAPHVDSVPPSVVLGPAIGAVMLYPVVWAVPTWDRPLFIHDLPRTEPVRRMSQDQLVLCATMALYHVTAIAMGIALSGWQGKSATGGVIGILISVDTLFTTLVRYVTGADIRWAGLHLLASAGSATLLHIGIPSAWICGGTNPSPEFSYSVEYPPSDESIGTVTRHAR